MNTLAFLFMVLWALHECRARAYNPFIYYPYSPVQTPEYNPVPTTANEHLVYPRSYKSSTEVPKTQFHAQDETGQYRFGYKDSNSQRTEVKTDDIVRGKYDYLDSDGSVQTVFYIADKLGFRVSGTNIPVADFEAPEPVKETPEVLQARLDHLQSVADWRKQYTLVEKEDKRNNIASAESIPSIPSITIDPRKAVAPPVVTTTTPPIKPAQNQPGGYNYGYTSAHSSKSEARSADGTVTGSYSYIDANGKYQTTHYISDASGFRVLATNLPVHGVVVSEEEKQENEPAEATAATAEPLVRFFPNVHYQNEPLKFF